MVSVITEGPAAAAAHILLAHGAGAPMTSPFMERIASLLAERGLGVSRFEFAYMAGQREDGKRRPPPRAERLADEYKTAVAAIAERLERGAKLLVGGKSMGGRVASLIADELYGEKRVAGLVCLGYPFHPPGKPEALRTAHLEHLRCPTFIVQGERDPFGSRAEVEGFKLAPAIRFLWAADGDHDLGPRGGSGFTRAGNLAAAADAIAAFAQALPKRK
jgi:predicted alpha/beta-hydrolase family hydrolase